MPMSFVGTVGVLMANSGLDEILVCAFSGVNKMLSGKSFHKMSEPSKWCLRYYCMKHQKPLAVKTISWVFLKTSP